MTRYYEDHEHTAHALQREAELRRLHNLKKTKVKAQEKADFRPFLVVAACGALLSLLLLGGRGALGL